jgi:hypothetical protein
MGMGRTFLGRTFIEFRNIVALLLPRVHYKQAQAATGGKEAENQEGGRTTCESDLKSIFQAQAANS